MRMPNILIQEKSPYLRQHAHNPVRWLPWSEVALTRAQLENKVIFLSIGYSTCHWCHVMEKECFMNEAIAKYLNEFFIPIKVDREERPDIDQVYMNLAQSMGLAGGWPLNLFLTPQQIPFSGGTYFPPEDRLGRPGFLKVLESIQHHWNHSNHEIQKLTTSIEEYIDAAPTTTSGMPSIREILDTAGTEKLRQFDAKNGGFGTAPKFPMGHSITLLLHLSKIKKTPEYLEAAEKSLQAMMKGGVYDQIGYGFHRYSTDNEWIVPHFEKMLYDQALLIPAYLDAYLITKNISYARIAAETILYLSRDLRHPWGGFYSAEDADTEGEEGLYYLWTPQELKDVLPSDLYEEAITLFGVTDTGNFEGRNILTALHSHDLDASQYLKINQIKEALLKARGSRVRPQLDQKIMPDWNGLTLSALAYAARVMPEGCLVSAEFCLELALDTAEFILKNLTHSHHRLHKYYLEGPSEQMGFLDDYVFFANGLFDLYQATFEERYLIECIRFAEVILEQFWNNTYSYFNLIPKEGQVLIHNPGIFHDGAIPSGNSSAISLFLRLGKATGKFKYLELPEKMAKIHGSTFAKHPSSYAYCLNALSWLAYPAKEIVLSGNLNRAQTYLKEINSRYIPRAVLLYRSEKLSDFFTTEIPFLEQLLPLEGKETLYVCENFMCQLPATQLDQVIKRLSQA